MKPATNMTLFPTTLGRCALAWSDRGLLGFQLPERNDRQTLAALRERLPREASPGAGERPAWVDETMARVAAHLAGKAQDFGAVPLDMAGIASFHQTIYRAMRSLAPGRLVTYGELAALAGSPGAARAVGQAMRRNRFPLIIPCHRVVASGGKPGGYSAADGLETKERLLALEGTSLHARRSLFDGEGRTPVNRVRALRTLKAADPALAALIARVGPFRLVPDVTTSTFEALAESIIYQLIATKAAETILGRYLALFGGRHPTPEALAASTVERIRGVGVSRAKASALLDLAAKTLDGTVPSLDQLATMSDEAIVERLTQVRGVGRWTVEMLLIFRLGRPDVLPIADLGVLKGLNVMLGRKSMPSPKELGRRGERWRPYRTIASWYLWRATEL